MFSEKLLFGGCSSVVGVYVAGLQNTSGYFYQYLPLWILTENISQRLWKTIRIRETQPNFSNLFWGIPV